MSPAHPNKGSFLARRLYSFPGVVHVWIHIIDVTMRIYIKRVPGKPRTWTSAENIRREACEWVIVDDSQVFVRCSQNPADWAAWTLASQDDPDWVSYP